MIIKEYTQIFKANNHSGRINSMVKFLWKKFEDTKLPNKMMLIYLIFTGFFLSISTVGLQVSLNIYDGKLYEKSMQELEFFTQKINDNLDDVRNLCYSIGLSTEIQESLSTMSSLSYLSPEYSYEKYKFRSLLMNEINSNSIVENVIYTDEQKTKFKVGLDCGEINEQVYDELLEQFHKAKGGYVVKSPTVDYPFLLTGSDILEVKNASLDYLGSLLFTCDVSGVIKQHINSLEAAHATLFVFCDQGMIYQGTDDIPKLPSIDQSQGHKIVQYQGQKYFMCYLKSSETDWMYVNIFPYSEIYGKTMQVRNFMLFGFIIIFLLTLFAMKYLSYIITKPLEQLTETMRIVEIGNFQGAKVEISKRNDEVGLLTQEFQLMLEKIDFLISENYEKQLVLKDTQYKMLRAQINPHFLYNTLNALNWMVKSSRNEEAGNMIVELGQLLRASFDQAPYTSVAEEVQIVRSYIAIQQLRYQKRAEFVVETEGKLEDFIVPRMILQPLVENSIYYGVDNTLNYCKITIRVLEESDTILLEVSDTGPGMSPEELEEVRNLTIKPKGHGIGLKNIRERLNMTYENSKFVIDSQLGIGTRVQIRVPKIGGINQDV